MKLEKLNKTKVNLSIKFDKKYHLVLYQKIEIATTDNSTIQLDVKNDVNI